MGALGCLRVGASEQLVSVPAVGGGHVEQFCMVGMSCGCSELTLSWSKGTILAPAGSRCPERLGDAELGQERTIRHQRAVKVMVGMSRECSELTLTGARERSGTELGGPCLRALAEVSCSLCWGAPVPCHRDALGSHELV